jgi:hypothetical protein
MELFDDLETFRQTAKDAKAKTPVGEMLLGLGDHLAAKKKEAEAFKKGKK